MSENVENAPFELIAELGDGTDETQRLRRREIPLRANYKKSTVTKKAVNEFYDEITEIFK